MINPNEWLRTRKNLLDEVKSQVQVRLGPMSSTLRRYARDLEVDFRAPWRPCSAAELKRSLNKSRVILGADFHAYAQSQKAHVRVLRDVIGHPRVILALECLSLDAEKAAALFLRDEISEAKFLEACDWEKNWGFPWEHYRPLFELARDRGFEVRALNKSKLDSLRARDRWAASRIEALAQAAPDALIYAIIGEWHLASGHLPKLLGRLTPAVLFQDVERLYFQLARKRREGHVDFMKAPGQRYCLMVSPPWMKWQSYLMYLEQAYDRDLQEDLAIDYTDHVASLIGLLATDLKCSINKSRIQVYSPSSKTSLARLRLGLPKRFARALRYHLEHDLSFYLPEREWLYLSRATINHASALAGQFVHASLSHRRRTLWNLPADFLPLIWVEAMGFFFSKWINPKRKAETLASIRLQLEARRPKDKGRKALLLALDHRLSEVVFVQTGRVRTRDFRPRDLDSYLEASRIVGSMLGERLFQKVRSRTISLPRLMDCLKVDLEGQGFTKFYWELIRQIEGPQA